MAWVWALIASVQTFVPSDSLTKDQGVAFFDQGSKCSVAMQTVTVSDSVVVAEDFMVTRTDGQEMKLSDMPKGKLTVLVFFDPDCAACRQSLFGLKHSSLVNELIGEEVLQVMTVHIGYEERLWRDMLKDMPETWMNTTTTFERLDGKCYDLSTLPAIYLLDADRKIMVRESHTELLIPVLQKLW